MKYENQFEKMTNAPIVPLIVGLSLPTVASMLVTNIYNMVDTAFVGSLGTSQSGAVGIVFSYMSILQAFAFMFGMGSGSNMSRLLGQKKIKEAEEYASTGIYLSFFFGLIVGLLSLMFINPIVDILGSTSTIAPYAKTYILFIILCAPFLTSSLSMNNVLRFEGRAKLGMIGLMSGAILNIFGDMLFMFVLDMGIVGAGLSTALSQFVSFVILACMFIFKKSQLRLSIKKMNLSYEVLSNIVLTGFPSLARNALVSVSSMLLNTNARIYGDEAVAAMSIVSRITNFVTSISIGVGQGFQPVCAYNYGANKYERVSSAYWVTLVFSEILIAILSIGCFLYSDQLVVLFRDDINVIAIAQRALRLQCLTVVLIPLSICTEMGFQATGKKAMAIIASMFRSGIAFIPAIVILSNVRGLEGIQEAQPLAYIITFVVSIFTTYLFHKGINEKIHQYA